MRLALGVAACVGSVGAGLAGVPVAWGVAALAAAYVAVAWSLARRDRVDLEIGEQIVVRRGDLRFELPRSAVSAVAVQRSIDPLRRPTRYELVFQADDGRHTVPFAEHSLWGGPAMARAREVAEALGVPIVDPIGLARRASPWRCERWMGDGEEWRLVLAGLAAAAPIAAWVWRSL